MLQFNWTQIPEIIMLCVSQLTNLFGLGSICTNMLPFMIDQMIGAIADEIGAAVQWNFWIFAIGLLTATAGDPVTTVCCKYCRHGLSEAHNLFGNGGVLGVLVGVVCSPIASALAGSFDRCDWCCTLGISESLASYS